MRVTSVNAIPAVHDNILAEIIDAFEKRGCVVTKQKIVKANASYNGLCIGMNENSPVQASLDEDQVIKMHLDGCPTDVLVNQVIGEIKTAEEDLIGKRDSTIPSLQDLANSRLEDFLPNIILEAVETKRNEELLEDCPYLTFMDMSCVARIVWRRNDGSSASVAVCRNMLESWGVSESEFFSKVLDKVERDNPIQIRGILDMMALLGRDVQEEPETRDVLNIVYTDNTDMMFGSGAVFYRNFADACSAVVGDRFIILPSSIHEVILLPCKEGVSLKEAKEIVNAVNEQEVVPEEVLTNSVYLYDHGNWAII